MSCTACERRKRAEREAFADSLDPERMRAALGIDWRAWAEIDPRNHEDVRRPCEHELEPRA